jgi:glycosyltransferase involved in cell wall biosynthesis
VPFIPHIVDFGFPEDRIELIYNGIDPAKFAPRPPSESLLSEHGLKDKLSIAYIGTLGMAHGLSTLLEAAERLRDRPEIVFLLIGDGAERARLEDEIDARKLDNVRLLGLQPRERMPDWIATIDILLVCLRDLPVFETVIPSKIFEFLAQERPVILSARGEIRRLVGEADAALVIEPENAEALALAIEEIRANPEETAGRARAGREWVERSFLRDDLARRMAGFLEECAGPGR